MYLNKIDYNFNLIIIIHYLKMNNNLKKICEDYVNFFKNGKVSDTNPNNVIDNPFFISDATNGNLLDDNTTLKIDDAFKDTFNKLDISLKILYSFIGDNKEYLINNFNFFTLIEIQNRINNYNNFFDVALMYLGMGHVIVLSYHPKTKKYFLRHDGGSNGYEREAHHNFYKNYDPELESEEQLFNHTIHKLITFKEFMNISNMKIED